jgi:hypothetical protein
VAARLESALEGRRRWMEERVAANWAAETPSQALDMPTFSERFFGGMFVKKHNRK